MTAQSAEAQVYALLPSLIDSMPEIFDSHDLILRLFKNHNIAYTELRNQYRAPGRSASELYRLADAWIGRKLLDFPELITPQGKRRSLNIMRNMSDCEVWKKATTSGA